MRGIVADDEFFARKALVKRIGELSEEIEVCEEAENGRQVMELLKSHGADLVVTDIRMPDMDGLEVAKQVKEQFPETSVIIESGYADFDYATTAIRYGVKEEKKTLNQKLEKQLAVYKGQLMDFSRILENETAAREILGDLFEKMKAEAWYLLTAQSCNKVVGKEEISQILEIFRKEGETGGAYFCSKGRREWGLSGRLCEKEADCMLESGRSCFTYGSQPVS